MDVAGVSGEELVSAIDMIRGCASLMRKAILESVVVRSAAMLLCVKLQ